MPELPEVETIKKDLQRLVVGKKILAIETDSPKQVRPTLAAVQKAVVGAEIKKIGRRAKLLQIFLSNGQILAVHLKLTGRLLVRPKRAEKDRWQHVTISLSGQKELRFADLRKFGWLKLFKNQAALERVLAEFGPEPLADLTLAKFQQLLAKTSRPVKVAIMDQKKISGVGNIYATDALFLAKIDPQRPANKISAVEIKKLFAAIKKVLKTSLRFRGASDQYYLDALGRQGAYQKHFLAYGQEGKKCSFCQGKFEKIKLAGRGTVFCPRCQK